MPLPDIPFQQTRHPGIAIHYLHRDEASGRVVALIRIAPGCTYPAHRHRGVEEVFVLEGGYRDERGVWRVGDFVRYPEGSVHAPVGLEEEGCVLFAMAERGIERV